jgi:hypothetical protein
MLKLRLIRDQFDLELQIAWEWMGESIQRVGLLAAN